MAPRAPRTVVVPPAPNGDGLEDDQLEDDDPEVLADPGDLQALADASYSEWKWQVYRVRSPEDMAASRSRQQTVWVLTLTGPIDVSQLRETVGGGVFRVWGYLGGRLRLKRTFELEGPPRYYTPPATPVAPTASAPATPPNGTDPVLLAILQGQQKTLDAIVARLAAPPAAAPGLSFRDALAMAEMMGGRGGGGGVEMKDLVALFQQGIEIGGTAVNGNEKSTLEVVLEKGIPALERVAAAMAARAKVRPRPGAPAAPRPKEPSSAAVVEDPVSNPAQAAPAEVITPEEQAAAVRWGGTVDALARAIVDGTEPADFADTVDALLLPDEVDLMLAGGAAAVMEQIRTAGDRYPILLTPEAEQFVGAVLASLAEPVESTP